MMQMNDKYIYMQITMYIHTLQINISLFSSHPNQQLPVTPHPTLLKEHQNQPGSETNPQLSAVEIPNHFPQGAWSLQRP